MKDDPIPVKTLLKNRIANVDTNLKMPFTFSVFAHNIQLERLSCIASFLHARLTLRAVLYGDSIITSYSNIYLEALLVTDGMDGK